MKTKNLARASACIMTLMTVGCGGKVLYPSYYALSLAPPPKPVMDNSLLQATVAVRRFDTPPYLRQGRIVYREAPQQIGFYEYRRWAEDPAATTTAAIIDSLRASRLFTVVKAYDSQDKPDYIMSGRLERLDEIDYGGGVRVEAKLTAALVNPRTGAMVWSDDASNGLSVDTRDMNSVVVEMSHAVEKCIDQLMDALSGHLRTNTP
jgi:uncharacterized lipoprotein YmbA